MTAVGVPHLALQRTGLVLDAIKFHESVFALPFAYTGMVLAARGLPTWQQFVWITVAMVSARTLGMTANQVIDRHLDARNPRNAGRHLPSGRLKAADMTALAIVSLGIFVFAASRLNTLALALAPVAAAFLVAYPYTKRFTWTANLLLGWALAMAPSAAWIGVTGSLTWEPVLLSLAVALWAGSFDILYHVQDIEFHVKAGLHSVAQRFGIKAAFRWSGLLDALAIACLLALGVWLELGWPYYVGWAVATGVLVYKRRLVSQRDTSGLGAAFFRYNAYFSISIFLGTLGAVLI